MTCDIFLRLGDIQSDSIDRDYRGQIEVLSFSWDIAAPSGGSEGTAIQVVKRVDAASPLIVALQRTGLRVEAQLVCVHRSKMKHEYLALALEEAQVTSACIDGTPDGLNETIVLTARRVKIAVTPQGPTGEALDAIEYGFDTQASLFDARTGERI